MKTLFNKLAYVFLGIFAFTGINMGTVNATLHPKANNLNKAQIRKITQKTPLYLQQLNVDDVSIIAQHQSHASHSSHYSHSSHRSHYSSGY